MITINEKVLDFIQSIASDGDLATMSPEYRKKALEILVDMKEHVFNTSIHGHA